MSEANNGAEAKWKKVRDGVATVLSTGSTVAVEGQSYTQAQLLAKIDSVIAIFTAADTAKAQVQAAVATLQAGRPANQQWFLGLAAALKQLLGSRSPQLNAFGIGLRTSPTPQTSEQKALAAAKRAATRKVRNVLSKKQRAAIPAVTGLSLQVVTTGSAATQSASPTPLAAAVTPASAVTVSTVVTPPPTKS